MAAWRSLKVEMDTGSAGCTLRFGFVQPRDAALANPFSENTVSFDSKT
jgi:hypothetical protein